MNLRWADMSECTLADVATSEDTLADVAMSECTVS